MKWPAIVVLTVLVSAISAISSTQEVGNGKVENNTASQKIGKRSKNSKRKTDTRLVFRKSHGCCEVV